MSSKEANDPESEQESPASPQSDELIMIARVIKPHGVKGELALKSYSADDKRFKKLKRVFARNKVGEVRELAVKAVRMAQETVLMFIEGIDDRDKAEELKNQEILVPASERAKLPAGRLYYDEAIGLSVIDDESGERLGVVRDVLDMPAADVYVIDLNDGTEHLLTNGGEEIVKIDKRKKQIRVRLLEQYGAENTAD